MFLSSVRPCPVEKRQKRGQSHVDHFHPGHFIQAGFMAHLTEKALGEGHYLLIKV